MTSRNEVIKYAGLSLLPPSKSRKYWRVKGTLPDGRKVDTTGGLTREDAEKRAYAAVTGGDVKVAQHDAAPRRNVRYATVLNEFVKPQNHETWGRNGGARHANDIKSVLWNH